MRNEIKKRTSKLPFEFNFILSGEQLSENFIAQGTTIPELAFYSFL